MFSFVSKFISIQSSTTPFSNELGLLVRHDYSNFVIVESLNILTCLDCRIYGHVCLFVYLTTYITFISMYLYIIYILHWGVVLHFFNHMNSLT